jgi:lysophospholipase L1-like esterase
MRLRIFAIIAAATGLLISTTSVSAASEKFNPPKQYYLALGDSLAYGYQQGKFALQATTPPHQVSPASFPGYVGAFADKLETLRPGIETFNFGCPGETTASYFVGCHFSAVDGWPLHDPYAGSQEAAALDFLAARPGQVSPITLDLGANDLIRCQTTPDPSCVPTTLAQVEANLDRALGEIRSAAPNAEIIVMTYYNPYALAVQGSNEVTAALNQAIMAAAAAHRVRVADAFTPINAGPATLCALTLVCTPIHDIHASDAGYAVIAQQFWTASGYGRLGG